MLGEQRTGRHNFEYGLLGEQASLDGCPRGLLEKLEGIMRAQTRQEWGLARYKWKGTSQIYPKADIHKSNQQRQPACKTSPQISAASVLARKS